MRLSFRKAADVSGLAVGTWQRAEAGEGISYASLVQIADTLGWRRDDAADRLMEGLDPDEEPEPLEHVGLAALAGELSPEGRAKVEGYIRAVLEQEQEGR